MNRPSLTKHAWRRTGNSKQNRRNKRTQHQQRCPKRRRTLLHHLLYSERILRLMFARNRMFRHQLQMRPENRAMDWEVGQIPTILGERGNLPADRPMRRGRRGSLPKPMQKPKRSGYLTMTMPQRCKVILKIRGRVNLRPRKGALGSRGTPGNRQHPVLPELEVRRQKTRAGMQFLTKIQPRKGVWPIAMNKKPELPGGIGAMRVLAKNRATKHQGRILASEHR